MTSNLEIERVGFAIARVAADQAEIPSLGAAEILLEVEAGNLPAKALHAALDFTAVGRRVGHCRRRGTNNRNAIVFRRRVPG